MDVLLMLRGEARHCPGCRTETIFLPVEQDAWCCTACDLAVQVPAVGELRAA